MPKYSLRPFPGALDVELDSRCGLRCPMCVRGQPGFTRPNQGPMSWTILGRIAREIRNRRDTEHPVRWIWAHLGGESLLNPDAPAMIAELVKVGSGGRQPFTIALSTAAYMKMSDQMISELLSSGLHRLHLSVDGVTKETYERIRVGAKFERTMENVRRILAMAANRVQSGMPCPTIFLQILRLEENAGEIEEFVHKYSTNQGDVRKYQPLKGGVPGRVFAKAVERFGGQVAGVESSPGWDRANKRRLTCTKPFQRCSIFSDGGIGICCYDIGATLRMGTLENNSINGVWRATPYKRLRENWLKGQYPKLCENC